MDTVRLKSRGRALFAVMLALVLALAYGGTVPSSAYAVNANCNYTVTTSSPSDVDVDAYQIFVGDVDSSTNAISNVAWGPHQNEVLDFLSLPLAQTGGSMTYGTWLYANGFSTTDLTNVSRSLMTATNLAAFESPENALAFIVSEINSSPGSSASGSSVTITAYGSFSNNMADYIYKNVSPSDSGPMQAKSGTPATFNGLTEGFYLFYSHQGTDTYSPIWTPVDGTNRTGAVKNQDILQVEKQVFDADSSTWGKITDAGSAMEVPFKVTGTLPKNPATTRYKYILHDKLSDGLSIYTTNSSGSAIPEMKVTAYNAAGGSMDVTKLFTASQLPNNEIKVECTDLYQTASTADYPIKQFMEDATNPATRIEFEYRVSVNVEADQYEGTNYSHNEAWLEYGTDDDPLETTPDSAYIATYELNILKIDSDTGQPVDGAKFTVSTTSSNGEIFYLDSDSKLISTPYEFESGNGSYPDASKKLWTSGMVAVPIIDAGTYVIKEVETPAGYKPPASDTTTVVVTATKDVPNGAVTALTATADNGVTPKANLGSGIIEIEIENEPSTVLPITGMTPNQLGTVIGILLVGAGVIALIVRNRRKASGRA